MTFLAAHAGGHPPGCPHRAGLVLSKKRGEKEKEGKRKRRKKKKKEKKETFSQLQI